MKYLYSYNPRSNAVKQLARLGVGRRIRHINSVFRGAPNKIVINWGASELPEEVLQCRIINSPTAIAISNKRTFFETMAGEHLTPRFTTTHDEALQWVNSGMVIVCRTILTGHSGAGITIARSEDELIHAPLYVEYKKKRDEFRVHVFRGDVFDIQQKGRKVDIEDPNWQVRNLVGGFIYRRCDLNIPPAVTEIAERCMALTTLDFGAVDVIYNAHEQRAYVLEVNTAPGLMGTTLNNYVHIFSTL